MMNPDEDHQERNNILMFILKNTTTFWWSECSPRFSSKNYWGQDTWYNTICHPRTATRAQKLYK